MFETVARDELLSVEPDSVELLELCSRFAT